MDRNAEQFKQHELGRAKLVQADCMTWMRQTEESSISGIVTDPPYGLTEYEAHQLEKRASGRGGIWRLPPAFDGHQRAPLPRFTALTERERNRLSDFFVEWGKLCVRVLKPGGHVLIATNAFMSQLLYGALVTGGLEYRGEVIRLVRTLRGGDRPKNAEREFPDVCSLPKGCFEPWGIFRKPLPAKMTVADCLRKFGTGGLRRSEDGKPFEDVIQSERTPKAERAIANHPSLKPQSLMRKLVFAVLPLGNGIVLDPFMGAGSTIAAAESLNQQSIGIELNSGYFGLANTAIPKLVQRSLLRPAKHRNGKSSSVPSSQSLFDSH